MELSIETKAYERLRHAVIRQACKDYVDALRTIDKLKKFEAVDEPPVIDPRTGKTKKRRNKRNMLLQAKKTKHECEIFFRGGWFSGLFGKKEISGEEIIAQLQENYKLYDLALFPDNSVDEDEDE